MSRMDWSKPLIIAVIPTIDVLLSGTFQSQPGIPLAANYNPHPITERFNLLTAYPYARSITVNQEGANNRFPQSLMETSAGSWAETNIKELMTSGKVERQTDQGDVAGPVSLGAAVSAAAENAPQSLEAMQGRVGRPGR